MAIVEIIVSGKFIVALFIYGVFIALLYPFMDRIYDRLEHPLLQWKWDHIAMPLLEVALMVLFIILAYPVIFGVQDAPSIISLFSKDELRINYLVNLLFVISLLFPLIPIIGNWYELILPLQGIAASMMIFSWLTASVSVTDYSFWPGWEPRLRRTAFGVHGAVGQQDRGEPERQRGADQAGLPRIAKNTRLSCKSLSRRGKSG